MKFFVQKQRIELLERDAIAADQIAFVPLHFVFDGAWEGLHKVVQITQCCETYNLILGTDGKSCLNVINLKRLLNGKQNVWKYQNGEEKSDSDGREKDV